MDQLESIGRFKQYLERRFPGRRTAVDYVSDVRQFAALCQKPWREVTMHDIDQMWINNERRNLSQPPSSVG